MTNRVQTLRSSTAGGRPSTGTRAPGELYTNWPDLQLGVINAAQQAVDLLAVRFFSTLANYVAGDQVQQGGKLYRAKVTIAPGAFNAANWDAHVLASDPIVGYVAKGGDSMTGPLVLPADPTLALQSATKQYVDAQVAAATQPFASGTVMLFYQAAAPVGWTKQTTHNDKALRVVSGSGGVAGGTNPFSTVMAQTTVGNHTLTASEAPNGVVSSGNNTITLAPGGSSSNYFPVGNVTWGGLNTSIGSGYTAAMTGSGGASPTGVNYVQGTQNITVTSAGGGGAHNHTIAMQIQYVDVILCAKN